MRHLGAREKRRLDRTRIRQCAFSSKKIMGLDAALGSRVQEEMPREARRNVPRIDRVPHR
jgi:hypothetical protein